MADEVLEQLKTGILRFQNNVYPGMQETYRRAVMEPQQPKTLIVTCADSRIDPELITQSGPGELFTMRNIGNMIPAYGEMLGGVSAVVEYAVSALKVRHVVVCGHMDCGAMKALVDPESTATMPTVKSWLNNAAAALSVARSLAAEGEPPGDFMRRLTEQNVLLQMAHLQTHPSIAGAIARNELTVSGWVYDIGTGGVRISEDGNRAFHPVEG
jgi:carbonic anhydrase